MDAESIYLKESTYNQWEGRILPLIMVSSSDQLFALDSSEEAKLMSFFKEYNEGIQISGLNLFLLGFLGLVFLAATGSIIYFKQLTEAHASKDSYTILHKLGVNTKEIRIRLRGMKRRSKSNRNLLCLGYMK